MSSPHTTILLPTVRRSDECAHWFGDNLRYTVDNEHTIELHGYQLYAVEKWLVERDSPVAHLVVYTGDQSNKVTFTPLHPSPTLSALEAAEEYDSALRLLKRESRPRKTPHGTLLVTSLARFRSDFTIVPVPDGNFLSVVDELYTNINLVRMGCGRRSALTLEEPSDATKDRFLNLYHLPEYSTPITLSSSTSPASYSAPSSPAKSGTSSNRRVSEMSERSASSAAPQHSKRDNVPTKEKIVFCPTVIELVKLIQASLSISGLLDYSVCSDGLLCDRTLDALRKWVKEIGDLALGGNSDLLSGDVLSPSSSTATSESVSLSPEVASSLLTVVLSARNRLAALSSSFRERDKIIVPKDPFLHPRTFVMALSNWVNAHKSDKSHHNMLQRPRHSRSNSVSDNALLGGSSSITNSTSSHHYNNGHSPGQSLSVTRGKSPFLNNRKDRDKEKEKPLPFRIPDVLTNAPPIFHTHNSSPSQVFSTSNSLSNQSRHQSVASISNSTPGIYTTLPTPPVDKMLDSFSWGGQQQPKPQRRQVRSATASPSTSPLPSPGINSAHNAPFFSNMLMQGDHKGPSQPVPLQTVFLDLQTLHIVWAAYDSAASSSFGGSASAASTAAAAATSAENLAPLPALERDGADSGGHHLHLTSQIAGHLTSGKLTSSLTGLALGSTLAAAVAHSAGAGSGVNGSNGGGLDGRSPGGSGGGFAGTGDKNEDAAGVLEPTTDLADLVRRVLGASSSSSPTAAAVGTAGSSSGLRARTRDKKVQREQDKGHQSKLGKEIDDIKKRGKKRDSISTTLTFGAIRGGDHSSDEDGVEQRPSHEGVASSRKEKTKPFKPKLRAFDSSSAAVLVLSGSVAGSLRGLWSGRIGAVIRLRERILERERMGEPVDDIFISGKGRRQKERQKAILKQKERERENRVLLSARGAASEGDSDNTGAPKTPDIDAGRSTEEEYDPAVSNQGSLSSSTGRFFSGRVRDKLETWTGLTKLDAKLNKKRHHSNASIDSIAAAHAYTQAPPLSGQTSMAGSTKVSHDTQSDQEGRGLGPSRPQSPYADGEWPYTHDDDDLLSSGQVSPVIDPRTPKAFSVLHLDGNRSTVSSMFFTQSQPLSAATQLTKGSTNLNMNEAEYEQKVSELMKMKPWGARLQPVMMRASSWSDPLSARPVAEDEEAGPESSEDNNNVDTDRSGGDHSPTPRHRHHRHHTVLGGSIHDEPGTMADHHSDDDQGSEHVQRRPRAPRRRSYHDLPSHRGRAVLPIDRMKIDVDLAGQFLVMSRREDHLRKVIMTMKVLHERLNNTNARLREEHESRKELLSTIHNKATILADIDMEHTIAEKHGHAIRATWYEADQMNLNNLWAPAFQSWDDTLKMRNKVFTMGGRKLAPGVHGAHGRYNREQWTLDGGKRLVDVDGRTESEHVEEVNARPGNVAKPDEMSEQEEEVDFVENPSIKPMWLLRMFNNWGKGWRQSTTTTTTNASSQPSAAGASTKTEDEVLDQKTAEEPHTEKEVDGNPTSTGLASTT